MVQNESEDKLKDFLTYINAVNAGIHFTAFVSANCVTSNCGTFHCHNQGANCNMKWAVCVIKCDVCGMQYIGQTNIV